MSIIKDTISSTLDHEDFDVYCDHCEEEQRYKDIRHWQELIEEMKNDGWKITKKDGQWCHYCEECKNLED